jgi:hypothetical protein
MIGRKNDVADVIGTDARKQEMRLVPADDDGHCATALIIVAHLHLPADEEADLPGLTRPEGEIAVLIRDRLCAHGAEGTHGPNDTDNPLHSSLLSCVVLVLMDGRVAVPTDLVNMVVFRGGDSNSL